MQLRDRSFVICYFELLFSNIWKVLQFKSAISHHKAIGKYRFEEYSSPLMVKSYTSLSLQDTSRLRA